MIYEKDWLTLRQHRAELMQEMADDCYYAALRQIDPAEAAASRHAATYYAAEARRAMGITEADYNWEILT